MVRCARSRVGAEGSVGSVRFVAVGQGAPRETREEGARDIAASRSGFVSAIRLGGVRTSRLDLSAMSSSLERTL